MSLKIKFEKRQHIHLILNNDPYFAKYSANFEHKLDTNNNIILNFGHDYHESSKIKKHLF